MDLPLNDCFCVSLQKMPTTPMLSTTATLTVQGPTYVPSTARIQPTQATAATLGGVGALSTQQQGRKNLQNTLQSTLATTVVRPTITVAGQTVTAATTMVASANPTIVTTTSAVSGAVSAQPATIIVQASPQLLQQQQGQKLVATQVRLPAGVQVQGQTGVVGTQAVQVRLAAPPVTTTTQQQQQQQQTATTATQQAPQQPKKGLSLTVSNIREGGTDILPPSD